MEQIKWVFGDNQFGINFAYFLIKIHVPTTTYMHVFIENWRKISFSYHQIPTLSVIKAEFDLGILPGYSHGNTSRFPVFLYTRATILVYWYFYRFRLVQSRSHPASSLATRSTPLSKICSRRWASPTWSTSPRAKTSSSPNLSTWTYRSTTTILQTCRVGSSKPLIS